MGILQGQGHSEQWEESKQHMCSSTSGQQQQMQPSMDHAPLVVLHCQTAKQPATEASTDVQVAVVLTHSNVQDSLAFARGCAAVYFLGVILSFLSTHMSSRSR